MVYTTIIILASIKQIYNTHNHHKIYDKYNIQKTHSCVTTHISKSQNHLCTINPYENEGISISLESP